MCGMGKHVLHNVTPPINQVVVESLKVQSPGALKGLGRVCFILGGRGCGDFEVF